MLQRDVTVDVPGGDPRVTIINRCQIITTYHDISRHITTYHDLAVGLAFFLVPKKFGYDCSSQSRRHLPAEAASLRPCTSTAAPRCTMLQRDVTVDVPGGDPRVTIIKRCQIITTYHDISLPGCGPRFLLGPKKVWIWLFFTVPEASSCRSSFFQHRTARCYRRCLYSATCMPEPPLSKSNLSVLPGDPCKRGGTSWPLGSSGLPSSTLMYFASFSSAGLVTNHQHVARPSELCLARRWWFGIVLLFQHLLLHIQATWALDCNTQFLPWTFLSFLLTAGESCLKRTALTALSTQ